MRRDTKEAGRSARPEDTHAGRRVRPVFLYDGDCSFCTSCARIMERTGPDAEILAWQHTDLGELGVTKEQATEAVQWIQVDGTIRSGHEAIAAILNTAGPIWKITGRTMLLPGISWTAARIYRRVADNRYRLPGSTPACARSAAAEATDIHGRRTDRKDLA
jgi:predicted DCC family thiol-disulfide oxidoreductase YuxK